MQHKHLLPLALLIVAVAVPAGAEDHRVTRCPPDLPYCIQETKKVYTPEEVARMNSISLDPAEEARKVKFRSEGGYRDPPIVRDVCPAPYRMHRWDGCQLPSWKSSRAD